MKWLILYRDGSEYSSEDGEVWDAPTSNVMVVFQADPVVDVRSEKSDQGYWIWKDGEWFGCDVSGFWSYLLTYRGPKQVLIGEVIPDEEWKTSMARLIKERFGKHKQSFLKREQIL